MSALLSVRDLHLAFGGLKAGHVVWLGSVTPPIWLGGPGTVEADFDGLGIARLRFV